MTVEPHEPCGVEGCFRCKLAGLQFSPSAMPSRKRPEPPKTPMNSWEKGVARDERNIPIWDHRGSPIPIKKWSEGERHRYETARRKRENPGVI